MLPPKTTTRPQPDDRFTQAQIICIYFDEIKLGLVFDQDKLMRSDISTLFYIITILLCIHSGGPCRRRTKKMHNIIRYDSTAFDFKLPEFA